MAARIAGRALLAGFFGAAGHDLYDFAKKKYLTQNITSIANTSETKIRSKRSALEVDGSETENEEEIEAYVLKIH